MFLYLTFIYVSLVVSIQHALRVITIMAVWQFVQLDTRMYSYMLLALEKCCAYMSRKIQKQYETNKNHASFIMVSFLVYINQFVPEKILKIWSSEKNYVSNFMNGGQCKYFVLWSNCKNCSQRKYLPLMYIIS